MSFKFPIEAAIFDMDGLLIDSEPFWQRAEHEVFAELGVDLSLASAMPDMVGLRINEVIDLWYKASPWQGVSKQEAKQKMVSRVVKLVEETKPLLPGVEHALELCKSSGLKIALASASPDFMLERVLELFNIRHYFSAVVSADELPHSKPHPEVYLNAAKALNLDPIHCVSLEDSRNGMIACKGARMRSIVVPATEQFNDKQWGLADVKIASLNELTQLHLLG
ncbi:MULTISPECIES: hexitol phosphatase HxpB [Proteus]|uniref:hexitol phosphatase HxpB n=1 Tax=Proteus TaxID=583 RepID=UPI001249E670|nr:MULTISPECIES: hexitol phosphatase HxpB [Proteus]MBG6028874.1 hexitol phosphatase HxpB [Proteus mirabilis]MBG6049783.1 hexitol phosphatase HxpB [Proteus mirabilis]QEZ91986.1 2-deoxyglucose-6-phosphatase [Proteus sp. CD3]